MYHFGKSTLTQVYKHRFRISSMYWVAVGIKTNKTEYKVKEKLNDESEKCHENKQIKG